MPGRDDLKKKGQEERWRGGQTEGLALIIKKELDDNKCFYSDPHLGQA